jgi:hypothetical protein
MERSVEREGVRWLSRSEAVDFKLQVKHKNRFASHANHVPVAFPVSITSFVFSITISP